MELLGWCYTPWDGRANSYPVRSAGVPVPSASSSCRLLTLARNKTSERNYSNGSLNRVPHSRGTRGNSSHPAFRRARTNRERPAAIDSPQLAEGWGLWWSAFNLHFAETLPRVYLMTRKRTLEMPMDCRLSISAAGWLAGWFTRKQSLECIARVVTFLFCCDHQNRRGCGI